MLRIMVLAVMIDIICGMLHFSLNMQNYIGYIDAYVGNLVKYFGIYLTMNCLLGQPGVKSGSCPDVSIRGRCRNECEFDTDCKDQLKCCQVACDNQNWMCIDPEYTPHVDPTGPFTGK